MKKAALDKTLSSISILYMLLTGGLYSQRLPMAPLGEGDYSLTLRNWFIQSSAKVKAGGEEISQSGMFLDKWYPASVPATVLGTLVQNNVYPDIFVGDNLNAIPENDFKVSWWFRTEFPLTADPSKTSFKLEFDGINYRANIWLNGKKIADSSEVFGPFRRFTFDVTAAAKRGEKNILAVEVFPPQPGEPSIGFSDWNPGPPDRSLGLWREVRIKAAGDISINFPFVTTKLSLATLKEADLTISAELENNSAKKTAGTLEGRLGSLKFSQEVNLEPKETKKIVFSPESFPALILKEPKIWWTHDLGRQEFYTLSLAFRQKGADKIKTKDKDEDKPETMDREKPRDKETEGPWGRRSGRTGFPGLFSDIKTVRFGIREVSAEFDAHGNRIFKLNGKKILIRGAGWTDDLLLNNPRKKVAAEVAYARHLNLNAIRLEGFWGTSEDLYNFCDENGLMLMAGWSCQWEWEDNFGKPTDQRYGGILTPEDIKLVAESWRDQVRWLRNHPSLLVWMEASDLLPKPELEQEYIRILKEDDPTRPALVSAKGQISSLTGKSGVKMNGPYDWVPPVYWSTDTKNGGAFGFSTEASPGPQVPPVESLRKMIPEKDLWPINRVWAFHCGRNKFGNLDRYNEAMTQRLGAPTDLMDYVAKAQYLNYEGLRAMFEAFMINKDNAGGIIHWMLNSAWPKLWWQLFDYALTPNGAFYGARKAGSPLHIMYNYGTREILAVNNTIKPENGLKALIKIYDLGMNEKYAKEFQFGLAAGEVKKVDLLQEMDGSSAIRFIDLRLKTKDNSLISVNFYCLSEKSDILDEAGTNWYVTPVKQYADLTGLQDLPPVRIKEKHSLKNDGLGRLMTVELENPTPYLAFQIELDIYKEGTEDLVLPIFWEDNFITLLPGEKRKIQGFFASDDLGGSEPVLKIRGWNIR